MTTVIASLTLTIIPLASIASQDCLSPPCRHVVAPSTDLDDGTELNLRINQTPEVAAKAGFESWFIDFDPVHAKARGEDNFGMEAETAAPLPNTLTPPPATQFPGDRRPQPPLPPSILHADRLCRAVVTTLLMKEPFFVEAGHTLVFVSPRLACSLYRHPVLQPRAVASSVQALGQKTCSRSRVLWILHRVHEDRETYEDRGMAVGLSCKAGAASTRVVAPPKATVRTIPEVADVLESLVASTGREYSTGLELSSRLLPRLLKENVQVGAERELADA
ncbi:MAG: hypothetical protein AKCLJLPJ_01951 [Fimbriimonadales bacterium]|nr:hypothetical protein [Fimbriimonadales bacterium]